MRSSPLLRQLRWRFSGRGTGHARHTAMYQGAKWSKTCFDIVGTCTTRQRFPIGTVVMHARKQANDNAPASIEVEVVEVPTAPGHWLVEAIDHGSEGEIYRATFDGSMARQRALDYARFTYGLPAESTHNSTSI